MSENTTSERQAKLFAALAKAQGQMGHASKDRTGQIGQQKTRYATLASVIDALRGPFSENGLCHWAEVGAHDNVASVTVYVGHCDGGIISSRQEQVVTEEKGINGVQGAGKVITYMRRYGLMALSGMSSVDDDDDGATAPRPATPPAAPAAPVEPKKDAQEFVAKVLEACANAKSASDVESARSWARVHRVNYDLSADAQMAVRAALEKAALRFASPIDVPPDVPPMGT